MGRMSQLHTLLALCLFCSLTPAAQESELSQDALTPAETVKNEHVLTRAVVAGASISDGFGLAKELGTGMKLAQVFEASCIKESASFTALGDSRFFIEPVSAGRRIVDVAIETKASCFIGVDFLFWYAYGNKSTARRLQHLEQGLKELERLKCPVLLGDMPDMSMALSGGYFGRPLITEKMIPSEDALKTLNARLIEWVGARESAEIIPLKALLTKIQAGETIELREQRYQPEELPELMQADNLHLSAKGSIAVSLLTADLLVKRHEELRAEDFLFDRTKARASLDELALKTKEEELAAREARKEQRRREREERREAREREKEVEEQQSKD